MRISGQFFFGSRCKMFGECGTKLAMRGNHRRVSRVFVRSIPFLIFFSLGAYAADPPASEASVRLSLKEATDQALDQSLRVQRVEAQREGAEATTAKAWINFYPRIDIVASAGSFHDRVPNPGDTEIPLVARDRNNYTGQLLFTQSLFAGFGDAAGVSSARNAERAVNIEVASEKNSVTETVIQLYYGIQMRLRQIEAEKEATTFRESQLGDVRAKYGQGTATDLNKLEAQYSLKSEEPLLANLYSELELTSLRLARLLGMDLNAKFELTDSLDSANVVLETSQVPSLSEAFKQSLSGNLETAKLSADMDTYNDESRKIAAKHLPKLDLQLAAGNNAYLKEEIATQPALIYSGQLVLTVPIFSGLESIDERRERAAGYNVLRKQQALLREKILDDLDLAYHTWKLALARIESETASVQLAQEAVRRATLGYRAGRMALIDVFNYYSRLASAKRNLAQAMYDRIVSLAKIRTILGTRFPAPPKG
jgi:outer membrane protein TolC